MSSLRRKLFELFEPDITGSEVVDRLFRKLRDLINPILVNPVVNGVILENRTVPASSIGKLDHPLGRVPRAFFIMTSTAGKLGDLYSDQANNPRPDRQIWVGNNAAGAATVTIFVI